jgi:outer membrane protein assembly factor BamE
LFFSSSIWLMGCVGGVASGGPAARLPLQWPDHIGIPSTMTASLTYRRSVHGLAALLLGASLAGCSSLTSSVSRDTFKPFVPEVVQGNFVSNEQRQALRPGMARAQVRDILGTPLIASLFHANRWDYAFSIQRQGVAAQNFRLTVYFKGDVLEQVDSDVLPSESEFAGRLVRPKSAGKLPLLQASEEDLKKFNPASTPAARADAPSATTGPAALPRSYPPLEPAVR